MSKVFDIICNGRYTCICFFLSEQVAMSLSLYWALKASQDAKLSYMLPLNTPSPYSLRTQEGFYCAFRPHREIQEQPPGRPAPHPELLYGDFPFLAKPTERLLCQPAWRHLGTTCCCPAAAPYCGRPPGSPTEKS